VVGELALQDSIEHYPTDAEVRRRGGDAGEQDAVAAHLRPLRARVGCCRCYHERKIPHDSTFMQAKFPQKSTFLRMFEEWRVRMRLTEDEAAKRIGYSRSYIQKIKVGKISAGDKAVARLADELRKGHAPFADPNHSPEAAESSRIAEEPAQHYAEDGKWRVRALRAEQLLRDIRAAIDKLLPP
jgi:hypothetical protein